MKNKNRINYPLWLCLMLLLSTGTIWGNNTDGFGTIVVRAGGGHLECTFTTSVFVRIANLDLFFPELTENDMFPLPAEYPEMVVFLEVDEFPVDTFYISDFGYYETVDGIKIFQKRIYAGSHNYFEECKETSLTVPYTASLMYEASPGVYETYPVCDYSDRNDIYSCGYFEQTAPMCGNGNTSDDPTILSDDNTTVQSQKRTHVNNLVQSGDECDYESLTESYEELVIICANCTNISENLRGNENAISRENASSNEQSALEEIKIQPNPFRDELEISWLSDQTLDYVELYNINGQRIERWTNVAHSLHVNTQDLPSGLYFIKVASAFENKMYKLVKSDQ